MSSDVQRLVDSLQQGPLYARDLERMFGWHHAVLRRAASEGHVIRTVHTVLHGRRYELVKGPA